MPDPSLSCAFKGTDMRPGTLETSTLCRSRGWGSPSLASGIGQGGGSGVMRSRPRLAGVVLSVAAVAATLVVATPVAAHTPYDGCGSGYVLVAKPRPVETAGG